MGVETTRGVTIIIWRFYSTLNNAFGWCNTHTGSGVLEISNEGRFGLEKSASCPPDEDLLVYSSREDDSQYNCSAAGH